MASSSVSLLNMLGITKSFPGVRALNKVDFEVRGGEIHALLGANGTGKSTLMKVLSGAYRADEGTIAIDSRPLAIEQPLDAIRFGIQCVYQEVDTALVPQLTVAENIMLDRITGGRRWIDWSALQQDAARLLSELGLTGIDVKRQAGELSIAQKQLVLIARALAQQAKFIIFDELPHRSAMKKPTSSSAS